MSQIMLENATAEYKVVPSKYKVTAKQKERAKLAMAKTLKRYGGTIVSSRY